MGQKETGSGEVQSVKVAKTERVAKALATACDNRTSLVLELDDGRSLIAFPQDEFDTLNKALSSDGFRKTLKRALDDAEAGRIE